MSKRDGDGPLSIFIGLLLALVLWLFIIGAVAFAVDHVT